MTADDTNVDFANTVENKPGFNIIDYPYFYDGGGVAIGDVNNDSLPDVFLTANQASNKLYINAGDFRFEDVSAAANVGGNEDEWSTGVSMADVNGDGWLDIYVCQVTYKTKSGRNLLYINNRDGTFTEQAEAYDLDFAGLSTQAAFFDYDRDGDLDLYLLNHSVHSPDSFVESWRRIIDAPHGDRLYRNDGDRFADVTADAGIYSSTLGYGLGLAVSDINYDGWLDIYIGNDFHENDYLYFNNGDGTFTDGLQRVIGHTSQSSMGNDVADFNNDGRVDIVSLDMLPFDMSVYRMSGGPDPDDLARIKTNFGYSPQYARNTLQLHRGFDRDGFPLFSEIGLYAGIAATDWSWAALFADFDNDGWKDLFVTNGIVRRPNDLDYIDYVSQGPVQRVLNLGTPEEQLEVTGKMPSAPIANVAYRNNADLTFTDRTDAWGLGNPGFSTGAAYGDLDGDGDLDLVVNNIDAPASIYRNNTAAADTGSYLSIALQGEGGNTTGIGTKVLLYAGGRLTFQEQVPTRGFQSSVSHVLHFGLGESEAVDSLLVIWPDGRLQRMQNVKVNRRLVVRQEDAAGTYPYETGERGSALFRDVTSRIEEKFAHRENEFADFEQQPLIPHKLSTRGPALTVGDVNGDGLDDFYIGGAHGQPGTLLIQRDGSFDSREEAFGADIESEDVDAAFFDADGDGDLDLYVVSGGSQYAQGESVLRDRLYRNDGGGRFTRISDALPDLLTDGCCVAPADYDEDGDIDVFVGSRSIPGAYGSRPDSYLLENDGNGRYNDVTQERAPSLRKIGMVTDALWADVDGEGRPDLVLVGEWMPVTVLANADGMLKDRTEDAGLGGSNGWWNSLLADDFDGDGDVDLVGGNLGENSVFRLAGNAPLMLLVGDFDGNGMPDPILAETREGRLHAWARRDEILEQMPSLIRKFPTYASYASASVEDMLDARKLQDAARSTAYSFRSSYFDNDGSGRFTRRDLPAEVQWSPIYGMISGDFNRDGSKDILTAGNFFGADTKQGRYDADYGSLLLGSGDGRFHTSSLSQHSFLVRGEARDIRTARMSAGTAVVVARNNHTPQLFEAVPDAVR